MGLMMRHGLLVYLNAKQSLIIERWMNRGEGTPRGVAAEASVVLLLGP